MTRGELIVLLIVGATAANLPFGAWRATVKRFSLQWFLSIHLPIPLILLLRTSLGLSAGYIAVSLTCAVAGQLLGAWLFCRLRSRRGVMEAGTADRPT